MGFCLLCLETNENYLDLSSNESKEISFGSLLQKYFPFCFTGEPKTGIICGKCRCQVEAFHMFYTRIESIHETLPQHETIFVETLGSIKKEDSDHEIFDEVRLPYGESDSSGDVPIKEEGNDDFKSVSKKKKRKKMAKGKYVKKKETVKIPVKKSALAGPFICQMCGEKLLTENQLFRHIKLIHELLEYRCPYNRCPHSFATKEELDQHNAEEHQREDCPICKKSVASKIMKMHQQIYHDESKKAICDICGTIFAHKYYLKSHLQTHEKIDTDYECDICGTKTKSKEMIRRHMKRHIDGPQVCPICGKIVISIRSLHRHKATHFDHKYVCETCGKGFHRTEKLREHTYIHTGFKDAYVCSCGRGFRFNSSYYTHRKNCIAYISSVTNNVQS